MSDDAPSLHPPPELAELAPGFVPTLASRPDADAGAITTWRLDGPGGVARFAKVAPAGHAVPLRREAERAIWAAAYLPVPRVLALEATGPVTVLLTEALPGRDGTDPSWRRDLARHVGALGRGLRTFHDAVGDEWCPFRFDVATALDHVAGRVASGQVDPADFHSEHAHLSAEGALAELEAAAPADEELVVCHGDYCVPNVLLQAGAVTGYVDLGALGVADRWWDIAVGGWSTTWNFGDDLEPAFYEGYGIDPDPERIRWYRLLYDLAG
ncbi:MAG TPA: aminoglycoside 3'-phosphotransferase [Acidimicrobiales bacterium]|jgi:kanamycin kinase